MADLTNIIDQLDKLTPLETLDLVKAVEEKWGVTAVTKQAVLESTESEKVVVEQTEFKVTLISFDPTKKVLAIREAREITKLGLAEAKKFVESIPSILAEDVTREEAEKIAKQFEAVGAKVQIE